MHRQTPLTAGFVGYTSGGSRTLIDTIDDSKMMQQMKGSIMGESREGVESPQNYGFTSVVMPATKGQNGEIDECAEGFMSYFGGNRSSNFCSVMDDRRYRLKELVQGNVAMFDHLQHQLHFNDDGMFMTGRTDKKMKFQLADPPQDNQQQSGKAGPSTQADGGSGSGSSSGGQSGGRKLTGQQKRYDKDSKQYLEVTKDNTNLVHDQTINYKTPLHSFQPGSGGTTRAGGPLVQIFGDKFTAGLGHFMKQVEAAPPIKSDPSDDQGLCRFNFCGARDQYSGAPATAYATAASRRDVAAGLHIAHIGGESIGCRTAGTKII